MRLLPRTLGARAFLLIALLIVMSFMASVVLFRSAEEVPRAHQLSQMVVAVVNLTRAAVLSADPQLRPALLEEMAGSEGIRVFLADPDDRVVPLPDKNPVLRFMKADVRAKLGVKTQFAEERNGLEGFWVSFFIGNEEFWVMMPKERLERHQPLHWVGWFASVVMLALLGGALIARQVGKPLQELARAARVIGRGETPPPIPETGAEETVAVARAFNQMSADLAAIERERSLVLAGISHDLRTPLTRLRLVAEFIDDKQEREAVVADVEQMDAVVGQFLDYARLGEQEALADTDLKALAESAAAPFIAQARSLDFQLAEMPPVAVRPLLLKRALSNLVDNGIKHGGGEVSLQLEQAQWHGRPCARFTILDRGPGIPQEHVEAVKRPFMRLEGARTGAGSGLGLAIVERAARLHKGELHLEPRSEGGLKTTLIIPIS